MSGRSKRAVVFSVSRIGDLVTATLTFDTLVERYGRVRVVTSPEAVPLLGEDDRIEQVEALTRTTPVAWRADVVARLLRARLRGEAVVNLEVYEPRWRTVHRVAGALGILRHELDPSAPRTEGLGSGTVPHLARAYADAVGLPGVPALSLRPGPRAEADAEKALASAGLTGTGPLVVMHPGSHTGWTKKRAAPDVYAGVVRLLTERLRARVILVGSADEAGLCDAVMEGRPAAGGVASLAGRLSLAGLPSLVGRARVFVGNDSGPLKIAEAVGTPTVSFWTVTDPARLGPRGPGHRTFILGDEPAPVEAAVVAVQELLALGTREGEGA